MSDTHVASAHIRFLIDKDVREKLGTDDRTIDQQVLRLCGGFNDLQSENARLSEELLHLKQSLKGSD